MTISRTIQNQLAKGDFDAIESEWLARLDEAAADLDYFVGVARALVGTGEESRARSLLDLLDEQLREAALWAVRLQLLKRAGTLFIAAEKLHPTVSATLSKLYGDRSTYKALFEAVGLHRATGDIPKTWEKVERLESLLAFDVGTVVAMEGKGVGRVVEANLGLESFKIDFEKIRGLTVGFKAAPKLLRPLSPEHVLRRKLEEPQALKALAPPELLRIALQSYDRPLTAGEIRDILAGIVAEPQWTAWWAAARKHSQVVASGSGARQTYRWAESSDHALDSVWKAFERDEPRKKIERLRREGSRDPGLRDRMAASLAAVAEQAMDRDPGLAFELWFAIERSGAKLDETVDWSPDRLLAHQPSQVFAGIEDRLLRERAYTMLRERREDWPAVYRDAMSKEADPRALDLLADGLSQGAPRELDRFLDGLLAQPHRNPAAFTWLAERAAVDEELRARNALRLLQQILTTLSRDEFAPFRVRLLALAESGGTVPRLLAHLTEDQAAQAEEAVQRAAPLEPYQREQLVNAIHLRFEGLRKETGPSALYATPAAVEAKRAELQQILSVEIPANRKAIGEARALGDLRENFEYKSARQRHEYLNARAAALNSELSRVRLIETSGMDTSEVRIGTRIRLTGPGRRTITILGPWESRPEEDVISYESELAGMLLGRKIGDPVQVGNESWTVERIEPYR
ncbi:MAG TPA: GreA/GreB family elongation factor [Thermoanaerobaculia bacterium]|jgi:transcription elongation GreA/GreB family factor|nr:GreA/GreB family elongation factor [Thermoanaerobaculia bacterium]